MALTPNPSADLGAAGGEAGPGGAESASSSPLDILTDVLKGAASGIEAAKKAGSTPPKKAAAKGDNTMLWLGLAAILLLSKR